MKKPTWKDCGNAVFEKYHKLDFRFHFHCQQNGQKCEDCPVYKEKKNEDEDAKLNLLININLNNPAFYRPDYYPEAARILRCLADDVDYIGHKYHSIFDIDGNVCGSVSLEENYD